MNKETLKGLTIFTLMVALAIVTAVVSANAQSRNQVNANIPFEFVVGDKTLPAGKYNVIPANAGNALKVQNAEDGETAIRLTDSTKQMRNKTHARLVFLCYGQKYFLAEVWNGEITGRQLAKSRQERAIERELASIPSKSDLAQSTYQTIEVVAVLR